nr:MAG TPA: hypothetical protein [Caudoviricetes sp.]
MPPSGAAFLFSPVDRQIFNNLTSITYQLTW